MDLFDGPETSVPKDGIELLAGTSSALFHRCVLRPEEQEQALAILLNEVPWTQNKVRMFGKVHPEPRLVAWYGDEDRRYSYSGIRLKPLPWTPTLLHLKEVCERFAQARFNTVLVNLYRDGQDTVGWHSDDEPELGTDPVIASLSLGAPRTFRLRNRSSRETRTVDLPSGSLLVMSGRCQADWEHQLPRRARVLERRLNLTFRTIRSD